MVTRLTKIETSALPSGTPLTHPQPQGLETRPAPQQGIQAPLGPSPEEKVSLHPAWLSSTVPTSGAPDFRNTLDDSSNLPPCLSANCNFPWRSPALLLTVTQVLCICVVLCGQAASPTSLSPLIGRKCYWPNVTSALWPPWPAHLRRSRDMDHLSTLHPVMWGTLSPH